VSNLCAPKKNTGKEGLISTNAVAKEGWQLLQPI